MKKIFLAEDEKTLAEIYTERFKRGGYEVETFGNGLELIQRLSEETPDVVLLDIMMPEMNGFEVLETLHKNFGDQSKKNVKVIVWSNLSNPSDIEKAKKLGASVFLKKVEFSGDDLVKEVNTILSSE